MCAVGALIATLVTAFSLRVSRVHWVIAWGLSCLIVPMAVLAGEHWSPYQGGGAAMWDIAMVFCSLYGALVAGAGTMLAVAVERFSSRRSASSGPIPRSPSYSRSRWRSGALRQLRIVLAVALWLGAAFVVPMAVTWMLRGGAHAGTVATLRVLRFGPSSVDDFRHFPSRRLLASAAPRPFVDAAGAAEPPMVPGGRNENVALASLLSTTDTFEFIVVCGDRITYHWRASGRVAGAPSQYFSVSKSVLATLVGIAVAEGRIASIDEPVGRLVPELAARFPTLTLRHLLDMRSGIDYFESDNPFGLHALAYYTPDLPNLILRFEPSEPPGRRFVYRSGDSALLSLALQRALGGEPLAHYAERRLWQQLGMEDPGIWSLDREDGFEKAWCCLAGSARDLAKLGRLVLSQGKVDGLLVVPDDWFDAVMRAPATPGGTREYARSWWPAGRDGADAMAVGKDGQFLYVDPATRTIVVRLGGGYGGLAMSQWAAVFRALSHHAW